MLEGHAGACVAREVRVVEVKTRDHVGTSVVAFFGHGCGGSDASPSLSDSFAGNRRTWLPEDAMRRPTSEGVTT